MLAAGMSIMLSNSITPNRLVVAETCLLLFLNSFENLYGKFCPFFALNTAFDKSTIFIRSALVYDDRPHPATPGKIYSKTGAPLDSFLLCIRECVPLSQTLGPRNPLRAVTSLFLFHDQKNQNSSKKEGKKKNELD